MIPHPTCSRYYPPDNSISQLPPSLLSSLENLEQLDLADNQISSLQALPLPRFDVDNDDNNIDDFDGDDDDNTSPTTISPSYGLCHCQGLMSIIRLELLILEGNSLRSLPTKIFSEATMIRS